MIRLREGLKVNDLRNLVEPLVSVDEYESKLGDNAEIVVVALFVKDQEPAQDLNRFIERGQIEILDAEVSPAPTEQGYYVVFIELTRDERLPERVIGIVDSIQGLVGDLTWTFKPYGHDKVEKLTQDNLEKFIDLDKQGILKAERKREEKEAAEAELKKLKKQVKDLTRTAAGLRAKAAATAEKPADTAEPEGGADDGPAEMPEKPEATVRKSEKASEARLPPDLDRRLMEFFRPSMVSDLAVRGRAVRLTAGFRDHDFRVEGFGRLERLGLDDQAADLTIEGIVACDRLNRLLGTEWAVQKLGERFLLARGDYGVLLSEV